MSSFTEYYAKNRDAFNKRRRDRYKNDPEYRAKVNGQTAAYRKRVADNEIEYVPIIVKVKGKSRKLWRMGKLCEVCERPSDTVRRWEALKLVPKPYMQGRHRLYSMNQINLVKRLSKWMAINSHKIQHDKSKKKELRELVREIKSKW